MAYQSNVRQERAARIQQVFAKQTREDTEWEGEALTECSGLRPDEIDEAVELMVQRGHAASNYSEGRASTRIRPCGSPPKAGHITNSSRTRDWIPARPWPVAPRPTDMTHAIAVGVRQSRSTRRSSHGRWKIRTW
jgi:hypothetical protein